MHLYFKELRSKQNYTQFIWGPLKAHAQNGVSGSYMSAIFKLVVHKESEIWTRLPHKEGLL